MEIESNATSTPPAEPLSLDAQFDLFICDVEALRTTAQDHLTEINGVRTKLKALQREHKSSTKELQTVCQTPKGLRGLKI